MRCLQGAGMAYNVGQPAAYDCRFLELVFSPRFGRPEQEAATKLVH